MDKNMKKWPQTETGSQTGAFTLVEKFSNKCVYVSINNCILDAFFVFLMCKYPRHLTSVTSLQKHNTGVR